MGQPQIIEEEPISMAELNAALEEIQERDEEVSFRAGKTIDHLNHLDVPPVEDHDELYEEVQALDVPRLKPQHINKILDLMPSSVKELSVILSGYTLTVNKEYQEQIVDVLNA